MSDHHLGARYPVAMRFLHWVMAVIVIGLLGVGIYMALIPLKAPDKFDLYPWHRGFGMLALMLAVFRLTGRFWFRTEVPAPPSGIPALERRAAKGAQVFSYAALLTMPVTGYVASSALPAFPGIPAVDSIWFFGLELPLFPVEKNYDTTKLLITIHAYLGYVFIAVILAHVAGALRHRFLDKPENDVLSKML